MKSWASNLFSKKSSSSEEATSYKSAGDFSEPTAPTKIVIETNSTVKKAKPTSVSHAKQPLTVLKKLAPIRDLPDEDISQIDQNTLSYEADTVVFNLGEKSELIYYLLKGKVELESDGGACYLIAEGSPIANLPLNSGKICGATATTKSPCLLLSIPTTVVQWWVNKSRAQQEGNSLEVIDIEFPKEIPDTQFFKSFAQAYRENKLSLPSLPQVAIKLRKAMEKENISVREVISIVQVDAPIVAKLIQVSNSALYAPTTPIKNCHDAVTRLGLDTTRKLVLGISVKQLFQCKSPQLMSKMQDLWKKSLHVSSLSFVLAQESGVVNPEDALLAGLICDIGAIPLIHFAEQHPESLNVVVNDLQTVMPYLNPLVGSLVLHTLGFTKDITEIPKHAEDWYYESDNEQLTLIDVVILAKLHSYFGTARAKELPYINSIPAYAKLKNGKLNPDFSLEILVKAQQRIDAAMSMFS